MSDAALKLRQAIHACLIGDAALAALLGGARVHDEAPRGEAGPHLVFEAWEAEDASTLGCRASRHAITLALWAGPGMASAKTLAIAARIEALLHDAPLQPAGHRLVYLYWQATDVGRDAQTKAPRLTLVFEALTEAA